MADTVAVKQFDLWRPGYGGASVTVVRPGTLLPLPIYYNHDGTGEQAPNPQILKSLTLDDVDYGRFNQPVYALEPYSLQISTGGGEAITRVPISTLVGEDANGALLSVPNTNFQRSLQSRAAYEINVLDHGELSNSSAENSDLINRAIGVAAAAGGGTIYLPRGQFEIDAISPLPSHVRLVGHGINATILRAIASADIITITGLYAGIEGFTLDGVNLPANSTGVRFGTRLQPNQAAPQLEDCAVKDVRIRRFTRGIHMSYGGSGVRIHGATIADCQIGIELEALDAGIEHVLISESAVELNTEAGVVLKSTTDHKVKDVQIRKCRLRNGKQLLEIEGAENTIVSSCAFLGGAQAGISGLENLRFGDVAVGESPPHIDGALFDACSVANARLRFEGRCDAIRFNNCRFESVVWELHSPENNILLLDCDESLGDRVVSSGPANLVRKDDSLTDVSVQGRTTDAQPVAAWSYTLKPGEVIYLEATAVGRQTDGTDVAVYRKARGARLAGATLTFDSGIDAFVVGNIVENATRRGRARILAKTGTTSAGTLTISEIDGAFLDNDIIGMPSGGIVPNSALVNGGLGYPAAAVLLAEDLSNVRETDAAWGGLTIVVNGQSVDVRVAGKAATNIEWTISLKLSSI